jgi:hypothetical protein
LNSVFDNWNNIYSFSEGDPGAPGQYVNGSDYCEVFYEDITPYVMPKDDFEQNPNYFRPECNSIDNRLDYLAPAKSTYSSHCRPQRLLHRHASPTTTRDEGFKAEYDASFSISYRRLNNELVVINLPVKIQVRMCEAYSKGRWKLVGNKYVMQY